MRVAHAPMRVAAIPALLATCALRTEAQAPTGSILHLEFVNATFYVSGYCAAPDQGKNSNKLTPPPAGGFTVGVGIADIVSVNGQPAKGTAIENVYAPLMSSNFSPGRAIADISGFPAPWDLVFMNPDGILIGTIHIDGLGGQAPRPPGAPKEITNFAWTVTGGTGAFFGVRGYFAPVQDSVSPERRTTDCEDPAYRRLNADTGGNKRHPVLYLVPLSQPQVIATPNGPAVVHSNDFSLVTTSKPAAPGEILSLFATGLGPTRPGVDPGQPFPASPLQAVNSPVDVTVDGKSADVLAAVGFPGAVDGYQVNFRVPPDAAKGAATVQVSAAWIAGPAVSIAVQ